MCLGLAARPAAQGVPLAELRAAFVYNFARFAEWPPEAHLAGSRLLICVAGDDALADALSALVRARGGDAGPMAVRRQPPDGRFQDCHVLYLTGLDMKRAASTVDTLRSSPVLTVSDLHGFAAAGGVVELFQENDKMRFAINTRTAERVRIRLSSRLLSLATIVKDEARAIQP